MKYVVFGADRNTGEDVRLVVEADSRRDATDRANEQGILVADIRRLADEELPPQEPPELGALRTYETKPPRPKYRALRIVASSYAVMAWVCLGMTALYIAVIVIVAAIGAQEAGGTLAIAGGIVAIAVVVMSGLMGVITTSCVLRCAHEKGGVFWVFNHDHPLRSTPPCMKLPPNSCRFQPWLATC